MAIRLMAASASLSALGEKAGAKLFFVPLRDLFGLAVWAAGVVGKQVEWRGLRFELFPDGRIRQIAGR
jgi:hypothetical protein